MVKVLSSFWRLNLKERLLCVVYLGDLEVFSKVSIKILPVKTASFLAVKSVPGLARGR